MSARVAGRVLASDAEVVVLADAFARVTARGPTLPALPAGELVVLRGRWTGRALTGAQIEERFPAPAPRAHDEFSRLVVDGVGARLRARSKALAVIRRYFESAGFIEVETPYAVPAPGVDRNVEAAPAADGWLVTSPELEMKRLIVGGIPRQYQLARVSRRDESGRLHEPEFTLLEWYRAFETFESVLHDTEQLVSAVVRTLSGRHTLTCPGGRRVLVKPPFERIGVRDAFLEYAGIADASDLAASDEDRYFEVLVSQVEPALAELDRPVFLVDYPISEAALSRPTPHDPKYAERFELYISGVELCNGYGELTDPGEQRRRFEAEATRRQREGRTVYPLNEQFLGALEQGMPPSAGNALGVDRLILLATGAECIQDVVAFPRARL